MKILVIPDIHGDWKKSLDFIKSNKDSVDKVVFLGDGVDDWKEEKNGLPMIEGFNELFSLKRKEPDKFEILIGNHDLSYISESRDGQKCSGHHFEYAKQYKEMFINNIDIINAAVLIDGVLFSHAGISQFWYNRLVSYYNEDHKFDSVPKEVMDEYLHWNDIYKDINKHYFNGRIFSLVNVNSEEEQKDVDAYHKYKHEAMDKVNELYHLMIDKYQNNKMSTTFNVNNLNKMFKEKYSRLDHCGISNTGNSTGESCVWIRPPSLLKDNWPNKIKCQIVGHTEIGPKYYVYNKHKLIICDNQTHDFWPIIDTEKIDELEWEKAEIVETTHTRNIFDLYNQFQFLIE